MLRVSNPRFAESVRTSFARQNAMDLIKASLPTIEPGHTEIHVPHWSGIEQQHGFVHGGVVGMIADSAAGYAAMTMVPEDASVLTVEYKMNLVAPADGEKLIARGKVVRPGRTLIVTQAEVFAVQEGRETLCALMRQTIMVMHGKDEKQGQAAGNSQDTESQRMFGHEASRQSPRYSRSMSSQRLAHPVAHIEMMEFTPDGA